MKTIGKTEIPTADYAWNPVVGCNYCKEGKCHAQGKGEFCCWAAGYMNRYWKQWAEYQLQWFKEAKKNSYSHWKDDYDEAKDCLSKFKPTILGFQINKEFPRGKESKKIAAGWMSDISCWQPPWINKVLERIIENNEKRKKQGLPLHVFQFLTKKPEIYNRYEFPKNCWLGHTVTGPDDLDVEMLVRYSSKKCKRFLYCEPLLDDIIPLNDDYLLGNWYHYDDETGNICEHWDHPIDWVIAGGQTKPGAKPINPDWVRGIRDTCIIDNIPFYFKSWGDYLPETQMDPEMLKKYHKKKKVSIGYRQENGKRIQDYGYYLKAKHTGNVLDGRTWQQFPEV